jgi:[ribosomal protein S5]-alanine N-acetyltransferase
MEIRTERLLLRELEESDAAACNEYERDPEVVRYQSNDVRSLQESLEYIQKSRKTLLASPRRTFDLAVVLAGEDRLIGRAGIHVSDPESREGTIWYVLHPSCWGKGYIVEAMTPLVDHGFGELGLHRLTADCDPGNHASARVAEKLGMRREAHFVENAWLKGVWVDSVIYAILDREWKARARG